MSNQRFRFRLALQYPEGSPGLTNSGFDVSLSGWEQSSFPASVGQAFVWASGGIAHSDGSVSNLTKTGAIGQAGPSVTGGIWHRGNYVIDITAKNNSVGGSAPLQSIVNVYGADNSNFSIGSEEGITYSGTGTWDVVPISDAYLTRRISFTLTKEFNYLFFDFTKVGSTTGYEVDFKIDSINLVTYPKSQLISPPGGWKEALLKLERHPEFHSLVEYFKGSFIFYGSDGVVDGGINFIKDAEESFGVDITITISIEASFNEGGSYESIFSGLLYVGGLKELPDNKIDVPIIRNDLWTTFINRLNTPVDLQSTTDLDGNPVPVVPTIDLNLPSQKIRQTYLGFVGSEETFLEDTPTFTIPDNEYGQIDFKREVLNEIDEKHPMPVIENPERPQDLFELEFAGSYGFNITIFTSTLTLLGSSTDANLDVRFQINDDAAVTLTKANGGINGVNGFTQHTYSATHQLLKGDLIRLYFFNNNATGASYTFVMMVNSTLSVVGDTVFPSSETKAYYLHDAFAGVIERIIGRNVFYSEILGRTDTNMRQYDENGCYSRLVVTKGLQIRGYTLSERPAAFSFNHLWKGANPILNLGLGYETISGVECIRLEDKASYYDGSSTSENFSYIRPSRSYDEDRIFKKIETGYQKWQSENISGLDDTQASQIRATIFKTIGTELTLKSEFIAASLAIETTRRQTIQKNKDYKFDNDTFIILVNGDDLSPDRFDPETTEDFDSVTGLTNASSRYNILLSPMRNFLRWANYIGGCLQKYLSSSYKFVSGEGNFTMTSDYSCSSGEQCLGKICDPLSENADISLSTYNGTLGYIHTPLLYNIENTNLPWEKYASIRDNAKKAIGISQTAVNYNKLFIKDLEYLICQSKVDFSGWAAEYFRLVVPESIQPTPVVCIPSVSSDEDQDGLSDCYEAVLEYGETI